MIAIVISCVALAVSIVSAIYTALNVSTNRRRFRGEADAARATHFKLKVSGPSVAVFVSGEEPKPSPHWLTATNAGHADAKNVRLSVDAIDTNGRWEESVDLVAPGETLAMPSSCAAASLRRS